MVPPVLKEVFVPGTVIFFLLVASLGTLLLYRRSNQDRAGRMVLTLLVLFYWILSTPATAVLFVRALSPDYPPVRTSADARRASAIVVLGAGMEIYRSRGSELPAGSREHSLRALEAARVYRLLDRPWVIVSGSLGSDSPSEAVPMRRSLTLLGVPAERILEEGKSRNTHDHALYVPRLLAERGITQFVLVTSRQHMARSLRAFHAAGLDPVPSSPEFFVPRDDGALSKIIPSESALEASTSMLYDVFAMVYYRIRGWA
jgi:uncharacterized SAM-binding protein YcdF (DUF218 family)